MTPPPESPLDGRRVLVTRAAVQADEVVRALAAKGAQPVAVSLLEIIPPASWDETDRAIARLASYDAIVFTSVNAVERFWARAQELVGNCDVVAIPTRARIFAVGPKTAEAVAVRGTPVEPVPDEFRAEAVAARIKVGIGALGGKRVLFPRAEKGRDVIVDALTSAGATVDLVTIYRTVLPADAGEALRSALSTGVSAILFASPSAATNFVEALGGLPAARTAIGAAQIAAIGPTTASKCAALGIPATIVAARATTDDLIEALETAFRPAS